MIPPGPRFYREADIAVPEQSPPTVPNEAWGAHLANLDQHSQAQTMDEGWVRNGIRHYLGMVSLIDQRIGDVLTTLDQLNQLEDTWIVYTADHGEMLGEHRLWAKMNFYRGSVQIPLLIVPPGGIPGRIESALVEGVDITATLVDIGDAEPPGGSSGHSLVAATTGPIAGRAAVHSRYRSFAAVRTPGHRFTLDLDSGTPCELFDLRDDPHELENRVADDTAKPMINDLQRPRGCSPHGLIVRSGSAVELRRIELLTSSMPWKRSTN